MTPPRVVLDSNAVLSALLFDGGRLAWMRSAWGRRRFTPLASRATVGELIRVLGYPKFRLGAEDITALLGDYLPFAETVEVAEGRPDVPTTPDADDQMFLDLAMAGRASLLVTGDRALRGVVAPEGIRIVSPEEFRTIVAGTS